MNAPVDVQLTDHDIVQPDLVVVIKARKHILTPIKVKGIPDLVVEILSPSKMYQRCGVPEYWIVFPDEHKILQLTLRDGRYDEHTETDSITMTVPPEITVDLTQVW